MRGKLHKNRKKSIIGVICVTFLFVIGIVFFSKNFFDSKEKQAEYSTYLVKTAEPILFRGIVNSKSVDDYYLNQSDGISESIHVENGQIVKVGDVLITYQDNEMNQQVQSQVFSVRQGETDVANAESDVSFAYNSKAKLEEKKTALQTKKNATKDEVEKTELNSALESLNEQLVAADTDIIQAERTLTSSQLKLEQVQSEMKQFENKVMKEILAEQPGIAIVSASNQTNADYPVIKIVNQEVFIEGQVSEYDYNKLKIGQTVKINTLDLKQETTGKITEISPLPLTENNGTINANSTMYKFSVHPDIQLQYGFNVQISLSQPEIYLPEKTIVFKNGSESVFLYQNGKVMEQIIKTEKKDSMYQVIEGVKEGQTIIENPDQALQNNQKVVIKND